MTGYILAGIVSGPFVLNLIPATHIRKLRIIDEASLGFIALAAGSKFNYFEMRPVLTSIIAISGALVLIEYLTGFAVFAVLVPLLGYYGGAGFESIAQLTWRHIVAMSMLAGSLTVARSPSSVMAIVDELKATGAFTRLAIGVTIFLDLAVIWLYDISESAAHTLTVTAVAGGAGGGGQQPFAIVMIALARLAGSTVASAALGIVIGVVLPHALLFNVHEERLSGCFRRIVNVRCSTSTALGRTLRALRATVWAVRRKESFRRRWMWVIERSPQLVLPPLRVAVCLGVALLPFLISHITVLTNFVKPLLVLLFASLVVSNYSPHVYRYRHLLHGMAKNVYCFYFTLTGAALELDLLGHAAIAASVLAIARIAAIVVGVFAGSRIATALARCEVGVDGNGATPADGVPGAVGTKYAWMAYVTQAGVALGLAKKVQVS